jgi:hypothetical protein
LLLLRASPVLLMPRPASSRCESCMHRQLLDPVLALFRRIVSVPQQHLVFAGLIRVLSRELWLISEKDAQLAQKVGRLQPFIAVFPPECMGQHASFWPACHRSRYSNVSVGGFLDGNTL